MNRHAEGNSNVETILGFVIIIIGLIVAGVVLYFLIGVLINIWWIIIPLCVLAIKWFLKNKKINEKEENIKTLKETLDKALREVQKENVSQIFWKSLCEQIPLKIDTLKTELDKINSKKSKEKLANNYDKLDKHIKTNKTKLDDFSMIDTIETDSVQFGKFKKLNELIENSSNHVIWRVNKRCYSPNTVYYGSKLDREKVIFSKEYYNKVIPYEKCPVYCLKFSDVSIYFYPKCIIEAKSNIDFKALKYSDIILKIKEIAVLEETGNYPDGTILEKLLDGEKEMYRYKYAVLNVNLSNKLDLDIVDRKFANQLFQILNSMNNNVSSNKIDSLSYDDNISSIISAPLKEAIIPEDSDIIMIMKQIIDQFGKDIIEERRFLNMLDDYRAFKNVPYFKKILTIAQDEDVLKEIVLQNNWNHKCKAIVWNLSQKYGLQDSAVTRVLNDIVISINSVGTKN